MVSETLHLLSADVQVDLSNCDLEPIHIPSSIQPHGVLLAARDSDLRVVYTSENSPQKLGLTPAFILEQTLPDLLGKDSVAAIQKTLDRNQYSPNNVLALDFKVGSKARFEVVAHRTGRFLCLELELTSEHEVISDAVPIRMEEAIQELGRPKTVEGLCTAAAPLVRALTGYGRVMVYRFDRDGHGEVIAEDKASDMEPFLGLHYPATDIPKQARQLYLTQRVRTIVDVLYKPVPLAGGGDAAAYGPLDMTYCGLRSVSPIHLEYLQNMGVGATFAVSLIHDEKLWGMIICHHRERKHLSSALRSFCDLLGQMASLLIGVKEQAQELSIRLLNKTVLDELRIATEKNPSIGSALGEASDTTLALVGANGAFLKLGNEVTVFGKTPSPEEMTTLMAALQSNLSEKVFSTEELGAIRPEFAHLAPLASGVLMVPLKNPGDGMMWVRGEVSQTVTWAGNPNEAKATLEEGTIRLSPRKSFAVWKQTQYGRSLPWVPSDKVAALGLQRIIFEQHLHNQLAIEQLIRQKRIEALSHMAAGLAHEISNPLAIIEATASNLHDLATPGTSVPAADVLKASNTIVQTSTRATAILRGLRGFAREAAKDVMEWISIYDVVDYCVDLQQARYQSHQIVMQLNMMADLPLVFGRAVQIEQVLNNLLNNAFDAVTQHDCTERWISLTAGSYGDYLQVDVVDSGPGVAKEARLHLMEPFFTTKTGGVQIGIGLSLSGAIAHEHGGTLTFEKDMEHTCFRLTLPINVVPPTDNCNHPGEHYQTQ